MSLAKHMTGAQPQQTMAPPSPAAGKVQKESGYKQIKRSPNLAHMHAHACTHAVHAMHMVQNCYDHLGRELVHCRRCAAGGHIKQHLARSAAEYHLVRITAHVR
jgi:hypothetical protein